MIWLILHICIYWKINWKVRYNCKIILHNYIYFLNPMQSMLGIRNVLLKNRFCSVTLVTVVLVTLIQTVKDSVAPPASGNTVCPIPTQELVLLTLPDTVHLPTHTHTHTHAAQLNFNNSTEWLVELKGVSSLAMTLDLFLQLKLLFIYNAWKKCGLGSPGAFEKEVCFNGPY